MAHLKSLIWVYFSICKTDNSKAVCKTCSERIPRGSSSAKTFNTTNLRNHLRRHPNENNQLIVAETARKESQQAHWLTLLTHQTTVAQCFEHQKPYSTSHPYNEQITNGIARMIVLDYLPFLMVEDEGSKGLLQVLDPRYKLPSWKHFSETVIPNS